MEDPKFLDKKYPDLPGSKPVERAVIKARRDPERDFAPHSREERIQAYLDRIDRIVKDERGWELLKNKITKEFVVDTDDEGTLVRIAHGLYESEKKLAVEQGRGADVERLEKQEDITGKYKGLVKEKRDVQERTLQSWLDYLQQNDAQYPTWFRYFVVRNVGKMGTLDKEKGEYTKRTDYTVAPFPELNSEALGFVYRMFTTGIGHQEYALLSEDTEEEKKEKTRKRDELTNLIAKKEFIKLYTFAQIETAGQLNKESLQGEWIKYEQGSDHHILEQALRGKGTGWCTAEGSAYSQLQGGDFYVYFTRGKSGTHSEPRIAIRMGGDTVGEVRGVNHRQELEPALLDIATQKYHSLPGGEKFDKKSHDMKKVTELVKKQEKMEQFNKDDLAFLYELNEPIEGFGYEKDPRIKEVRDGRSVESDMAIIFECEKSQIANNANEVNPNTVAYVGEWNTSVYNLIKKYPNIRHLYEEFPEKKIFMETLKTNPLINTPEKAEKALKAKNIGLSDLGKYILYKTQFSQESQTYELVQLTVAQLGFAKGATMDKIYEKAKEIELEPCPAEVGPHLRLQYEGVDRKLIAMKEIADRNGSRDSVFELNAIGTRMVLDVAYPDFSWLPSRQFVFVSRKPS